MTSSYWRDDKEFSAKRSLILQVYHTHDIQGSSFQIFFYYIILLKLGAVGQLLTNEILEQSDTLLEGDGKKVAELPRASRVFGI